MPKAELDISIQNEYLTAGAITLAVANRTKNREVKRWVRQLLLCVGSFAIIAPMKTVLSYTPLHFGDTTVEFLHTPGHTEDHITIYLPKQKILFAGDNIFTLPPPDRSLIISLVLDNSFLTAGYPSVFSTIISTISCSQLRRTDVLRE